MSIPESHETVRSLYPYYLMFEEETLPFQSLQEKEAADKHIDDFLSLINMEKERNPEVKKKLDNIYLNELLKMRPPKMNSNRCEDPDQQEKWLEWNKYYAFRDDHNELLFESV